MTKSAEPSQQSLPVVVFADGASSGNPGPGGWGAIIARPEGIIEELGGGERATTNNRMELTGALVALKRLATETRPIDIYTDSTYVIKGITQWVFGWRNKGWKTAEGQDVANQDLWRELMRAVAGKKVKWKYVRGHAGIPGNERVDEIAVAYTKGRYVELYRGPLLSYDIPIYDLPENTDVPERPKNAKVAKPSAYSYLSLLDGKPMRHASWADCERRVKGRSGAKFKKALSETDEKSILQSWGYSLRDLL